MTALLPDLDEARGARPCGPLAVRVSYVRGLPGPVLDAAARGEDVPLRDHRRAPELVRHYWPAGGFDEALALLARLAASSPAVRSGRWRVAGGGWRSCQRRGVWRREADHSVALVPERPRQGAAM